MVELERMKRRRGEDNGANIVKRVAKRLTLVFTTFLHPGEEDRFPGVCVFVSFFS